MEQRKKINENRRNLLKFSLIGGGVFLLGKVFGPGFLKLFSGPKEEYYLGNFRVTEDRKELIISDRTGEEILIVDKGE